MNTVDTTALQTFSFIVYLALLQTAEVSNTENPISSILIIPWTPIVYFRRATEADGHESISREQWCNNELSDWIEQLCVRVNLIISGYFPAKHHLNQFTSSSVWETNSQQYLKQTSANIAAASQIFDWANCRSSTITCETTDVRVEGQGAKLKLYTQWHPNQLQSVKPLRLVGHSLLVFMYCYFRTLTEKKTVDQYNVNAGKYILWQTLMPATPVMKLWRTESQARK